MPCVALGQKKIYRASRARRHDRKILRTQPVSQDEKLKPETAELVKTAAVAVEVVESTSQKAVSQKPKTAPKSKTKSPSKLTRGIKKLQTAVLRRSAVKAARKAQKPNTPTAEHADRDATMKSQTAKAASAAVRLKDGDRIQIRPHRARPSAKTTTKTAVVTGVTKAIASSVTTKTAAITSQNIKPTPTKLKKAKRAKKVKTQSVTTQAPTPKAVRALKKNVKANTKPKRRVRFHRPSRAELINAESRLGSTIFGPVPAGHRREFFHDRENIWIWHESWVDADRHARQLTVRYEVRPSGVYKKLSAGKYFKIEGAELDNFRKATRAYLSLIKQHIYSAA